MQFIQYIFIPLQLKILGRVMIETKLRNYLIKPYYHVK